MLCYNLVFQKFCYMFRLMKFHHQEVSCRTQALWYIMLCPSTEVLISP
jgi:hypothetical protein